MRALGDEVVQEGLRSPLSVLLLDDNPDDRILAKRELVKAFPGVHIEEVVDKGGFTSALERGGFDVVVTDFQLRWSDGLQVLQEVKGRYPFCPVVMFTATGSEELAVEVMKMGLDDYIIKSSKHFMRLPATIGSVLRSAEEKRRRREAERELATARREWEAIFQAIGQPTFILDDSFRVIEVNRATEKATGMVREELLGKRCFEFMHHSNGPPSGCPLEVILEQGVDHFEGEMEALGLTLWVSCTPVPGENGRPTKYIHIATDITSRRDIEDKLKETTTRLETLINATPDIVCFKDAEGRWLEANEADLKLFQLEGVDYRGKKDSELAELTHPVYREAFLTCERTDEVAWRKGSLARGDEEIILPDGTTRIYDLVKIPLFHPDGSRKGLVVLGRDVTERRRMEEEFLKMEKLESLGVLAGGIAHDFNNLLMGIMGTTSLILLHTPSQHPDYQKLKNIEQYVQSGTELTRQLLGFARGGKYEVKPTNLNELISNQIHMFARTRKEITIHEKYDKNLWIVDVDRGQIEQSLLNLYINAWQAMPKGGDLYVKTENIVLDENFIKLFTFTPGNYAKISVTDTGVGMDETTRQRIFEPFFSTKEMGRGTGLGLASVYGIIKNHGGIIDVFSEKGKGTTFTIYLPAAIVENPVPEMDDKKDGEIQMGTETILLIDDEAIILDVGKQMLEKLGYRVIIANSGREGLEIYKTKRNEIDLIILDMIMPGMGGNEVYKQLQILNPTLKVLLSSGYSLDGLARDILNQGSNGFIQKPFQLKQLSQKIRKILA